MRDAVMSQKERERWLGRRMSVHATLAEEDEAAIGGTEDEERPRKELGKPAQEVWVKDEAKHDGDDDVIKQWPTKSFPEHGDLVAVYD